MRPTLVLRVLCAAGLLALPVAARAMEKSSTVTRSSSDDDPGRKVHKIVVRGVHGSFLGIGVADVDADKAKALRLREERGVEVKSVEEDSPAAKAGMKEGDVVLEYNGERVEGTVQFIRMVRETPAGRQVKITVWRDGGTQNLTATIVTRKPRVFRWRSDGDEGDESSDVPEPPEPPEAPEPPESFHFEMPDITIPEVHIPDGRFFSWRGPRLGIESETLGSQLAEYFGVKEGVLVRAVVKGSAAERAGLKAGDVITKIDGEKVAAPSEISSALRSLGTGKSFPIAIVRSGKEMTLTARLEEEKKKSESAVPRGIRQKLQGLRSAGSRV